MEEIYPKNSPQELSSSALENTGLYRQNQSYRRAILGHMGPRVEVRRVAPRDGRVFATMLLLLVQHHSMGLVPAV